tara:strand:- start:18 stop:662 length:645 start_codon:yes stop_codon:yes gene_type:complete
MINKLSPLPKFYISRYKSWKSNTFEKNSNKFKKLASLGQNPKSMIISCCDSRVHVTSIFEAFEGDLFIHRNIANLVPPFSSNGQHIGTLAAIEYAIQYLKIKHFIILGHTGCGGINSIYNLHKKKTNNDNIFINKWLENISSAFKNIPENISEEKQIKLLEEESIKKSLKNLFKYPTIKKCIDENSLSVHGLIHDIGSGKLKYLNPLSGKFENI